MPWLLLWAEAGMVGVSPELRVWGWQVWRLEKMYHAEFGAAPFGVEKMLVLRSKKGLLVKIRMECK